VYLLQLNCNLTVFYLQLWYSQQAAEGDAPMHPLGFNSYWQFGPIKVVGAGGGGDDLPNIDAIAVGDSNGADLDLESRFSG
jgi:hypothetical protein